MGIFSAAVGIVVETVKLPADVVCDTFAVMADASEGDMPLKRVKKRLEKIKEEAEKADDE